MINLYSTHCPKCRVLELKLQQKNIEYNVIDDIDLVVSVGEDHDIMSAPFIEKDNIFYNFTDAVKLINDMVGREI